MGSEGGFADLKSWHTSGAAEAANGARDNARGVFPDQQRVTCAASSPASGLQVRFGVRKVVSSRIPRVSLRLRGRVLGPAEVEKWARFGPRVGATALAKEPPHLSAAFQLRPCQLLVGVKCRNGVRGRVCGFKSWHTSGAAEAANGARDNASGVFPDQ